MNAEAIEHLCQNYHLTAMYSFGSRAREVLQWTRQASAQLAPGPSDVDVGVLPEPGRQLTVREKVAIAVDLEDLLGVNRVDVVVLPEADPFVAAEIIRGERLYAQDADLADEYDLYILRRAGDAWPLEQERQRLIVWGRDGIE